MAAGCLGARGLPLSTGSQSWLLLSTQKSGSRNYSSTASGTEVRTKAQLLNAGDQAGTGLCAAIKALWKLAVESGNPENRVDSLHGLSVFSLKGTFQFQWKV